MDEKRGTHGPLWWRMCKALLPLVCRPLSIRVRYSFVPLSARGTNALATEPPQWLLMVPKKVTKANCCFSSILGILACWVARAREPSSNKTSNNRWQTGRFLHAKDAIHTYVQIFIGKHHQCGIQADFTDEWKNVASMVPISAKTSSRTDILAKKAKHRTRR